MDSAFLILIRGVIHLYDVISFPVYLFIDKPWKVLKKINYIRSEVHEEELFKSDEDLELKKEDDAEPDDVEISKETWTCSWPRSSVQTPLGKCNTFAEGLSRAMQIHRGKKAFGYRKILGVENDNHQGSNGALRNGNISNHNYVNKSNGHVKKETYKVHEDQNNNGNYDNNNNKKDTTRIEGISNGKTSSTEQIQINKQIKRKVLSSEYTWINYEVLDNRLNDIVSGLTSIGVKYQDKVVVILETRLEWSMTAYALMRMGSVLCTMFSTLGLQGFIYGINELQSEVVITNFDNANSILCNLDKLPSIKKVIVVIDSAVGDSVSQLPTPEGVEVMEFYALESRGRDTSKSTETFHPQPDDLALIMYSSGTTGNPKGVMFTQQMLSSAYDVAYSTIFDRLWPEEMQSIFDDVTFQPRYMSYLPIAHIFEFIFNSLLFESGFAIGFASPFTAFEGSIGLSKDSLPDVKVLNPHVICSVPLILERIKGKIKEQLKSKPKLIQNLFAFGIDYKNFWNSRGFKTRLLDRLLFKKTHDILGVNAKVVLAGSAPLAVETHRFMRNVLNVNLLQGYGTTETQALVMVQDHHDYDFGSSGFVHHNLKLKLQDWKEGGYGVNDQPNPRGELLIGGNHVSLGYFMKEQETNESFFTDSKGMRWFVSGDIVSIDRIKGTVTIIDRKKDLIKLQNGEFVSLGKIEAGLKDDPVIDNVLVAASSLHSFVVAVILPDKDQLTKLAKLILGEEDTSQLSFSDICGNKQVIGAVRASITETAKRIGLTRIEIPVKIFITDQEWTPTSGLVTASLKIKRKALLDYYQNQIQDMIHSK